MTGRWRLWHYGRAGPIIGSSPSAIGESRRHTNGVAMRQQGFHDIRDLRAILVITALVSAPLPVEAQGIATASIRGSVETGAGAPVEDGRVRVISLATGFTADARVRQGRFLVQGLEVGGPYIVEVRQIGFAPQQSNQLFLTLGEPAEIRFVMQPMAVGLDTVRVSGVGAPAGGGTAMLITDSVVHRLPTLNRNFYDFVVLAPQLSSKIGSQRNGFSAAGANFRFNNFLINGVDERFANSNLPAATAGKSVPLDAVKEYQVLVAPYDVRYGDFAGALLNTVTQSGTNALHGSGFAYWRTDRLARGGNLGPSQPYERIQYGFSLGGPLVRDRVHFFLAPELQSLSSPAPGPYVGQSVGSIPAVPVSGSDIDRLDEIMRGHGLVAGSGGPVEVHSPLRNVFGRLDAALPRWRSHLVGFVNYARAEDEVFTRSTSSAVFPLSTYMRTQASSIALTSLQLRTDLPRAGGGHNELQLSQVRDRVDQLPAVRQPLVRVRVPGTAGGLVTLNAGAAEPAHGRFGRAHAITIKDDLSIPWGSDHVVRLGVSAEFFSVRRGGVERGYGVWTFSSLDSLALGVADVYELRKDFTSAIAPLRGAQYAAYIGDDWRAGDRVTLTMGIRADIADFRSNAPYNPTVDSIFDRRTDEMPRARLHLSPRFGFDWVLPSGVPQRLRGGVGVFTGRPPRAWIVPAVSNYGLGIGVLSCGLPADPGPPPPFEPDYSEAPTACVGGPDLEATRSGDVDLLDRELRMAQSLRASVAYERNLPWDFVATTEALVSRHLSDFVFENLNLAGRQAVDRFGRVLYGNISLTGVATPVRRSGFAGVIDLQNTSRNYAYQLSTRLERRFLRSVAASASYTWSRTRDVQSPSRVNAPGLTLWGDARALSGRHGDLRRGISLNDIPHRLVAAVTFDAPWSRWTTAASFYYVAESGGPFTYLAWGERRGDLNADGSNLNDPIYVPRSSSDPEEIVFSGRSDAPGADNSPEAMAERVTAQQTAFEAFIARSHCLREQRGRIVERHSCREPWSHTSIASLRQSVPIGDRRFELEVDVFNVLNLLNGRWGRYRVADPRLLEHVGQTSLVPETAQSVFRFDTTRPSWQTLRTESAFQLQLAVRHRF
jgi:hypothetical protein